jgi:hypothetical protein
MQVLYALLWPILVLTAMVVFRPCMKRLVGIAKRAYERHADRGAELWASGMDRLAESFRFHGDVTQRIPEVIEEYFVMAWKRRAPKPTGDVYDVWTSDDAKTAALPPPVIDEGPHLGRELIRYLRDEGLLDDAVLARLEGIPPPHPN